MIIQGVLTWHTVKAKSQDSSYNILFMCKKKNAYLKNLNILPELVLPSEKPRLSFRFMRTIYGLKTLASN